MRIDDLQQGLASARDEQLAADQLAGRLGVDRHVRRQRLERAGIALLVVVLLAGAGTFLATRGTDEQRVISGPGAVTRLLPQPQPPGESLLQEFPSPPVPAGVSAVVERVAWTNSPQETPLPATPVVVVEVATSNQPGALRVDPVTITDQGGLTQTRWADERGHVFTVRSVGVDPVIVDQVRASALVDNDDRFVASPPVGFREVARDIARYEAVDPAAAASISVFGTFVNETEAGYVVIFNDETEGVRPSYSVSTAAKSKLWFVLASPQHSIEMVDVRGRVGYRWQLTDVSQSASSDGTRREEITTGGSMFFWWESDDVLVATLGPTENDARALAESLRVVDDETWGRFVATTSPMVPTYESPTQTPSSVGPAFSSSTITVP